MKALLYFTDPMCSWCWGFAPVIAEARSRLKDDIDFQMVMCGLAPDSDAPMEADMLEYVQGAWRAVAARSGVEFNHAFWEEHHPKRSTWPACRAVLAAGDRGEELFGAIQRAYYLEARDPSDLKTLIEIAEQLGLDRAQFEVAINAPETHQQLAADFEVRDRFRVSGYPSVGVLDDGKQALVSRGWIEADDLLGKLGELGLLNS